MEDILNKNIFNDKDLYKLSPDYTPSNVLLRMETRRTMVKDTHDHGILRTCNWQRKTKKSKHVVMNKEIANIRNGFHNNNLKNQVMLKEPVHSLRFKSPTFNNNLLFDDLKDDLDVFISKSPVDTTKLVICNDSEFKLTNKPALNKTIAETRKMEDKFEKHESVENKEKDENNDFMRIECKYVYSPCHEINTTSIHTHETAELSDNGFNVNCFSNKSDEHVNDLQSLLIMMAISTKSNDYDNIVDAFPKQDEPVAHIEFINRNDQDKTIKSMTVETDEDITNILNVVPLRVQLSDKQITVLRKYVNKWKNYVSRKKEYLLEQRQEALNIFFEKLSRKKLNAEQSSESIQKAKMLARDCSTYQHRYKVQKHIIALQKAKLEEQNRIIEELKYNKIIEASKQSVEEMREQVRKTYYDIDRQLKPKIKCLTKELKIHELEEPALVLHCLKVPQFLQRMEKRAREREEKHAMIRERRKQMEEERIRLKQQAELAKAEMDKEEKMRRIFELREKRKKERIEAIRKKQHVEKMRALNVMADLHYERYLMMKYGIRPLKKLIEIKRDNLEKAKRHYAFQLKKNVFLHLMWYTEDMWFERYYKADDFHRKKVLRKAFNGWKQVQQSYIIKKQVAEDYYDLYVIQLIFRHFRKAIEIVKKENEMKFQKAVIYYNSNLKFKIFTCWRTLPALNALKREQDARKARWREKVLLVVPDYMPPDD